jgi:hypothetical protein
VNRAKQIQDKLNQAKNNLEPLRAILEECFTIVKMIEDFNRMTQGTKIPTPLMRGNPSVIQQLYDFKFELPVEWQRLGRNEKRVTITIPYGGRQQGETLVLPTEDAED